MALTTEEQAELKKVVMERNKEKAIDNINQIAYADINTLEDQIQARENKRIDDIKSLG